MKKILVIMLIAITFQNTFAKDTGQKDLFGFYNNPHKVMNVMFTCTIYPTQSYNIQSSEVIAGTIGVDMRFRNGYWFGIGYGTFNSKHNSKTSRGIFDYNSKGSGHNSLWTFSTGHQIYRKELSKRNIDIGLLVTGGFGLTTHAYSYKYISGGFTQSSSGRFGLVNGKCRMMVSNKDFKNNAPWFLDFGYDILQKAFVVGYGIGW